MKWVVILKRKPFWAILAIALTSFGLGHVVPFLPAIEAVTGDVIDVATEAPEVSHQEQRSTQDVVPEVPHGTGL